jgi:Zn-dependent protease
VSPTLALLAALALCAGTIYTLRGGFRDPHGHFTIAGLDPQSTTLALIAVAAAAIFWGPYFGISLVFLVALHEFGHVAAYRICGHSDARFRLIPLLGGVAISNTAPVSQEKQFFISIMGPAICVGPVILAYVLAFLPSDGIPLPVREFLWSFATLGGALNFFNLLPFWPLDGGRMTHILAWIYWKGAARVITIAMSALFAAWALFSGHMILFLFALMGAQSLTYGETLTRIQRPMSKRRGLWAIAAYGAVTAAHLWVGYYFVVGMFLR